MSAKVALQPVLLIWVVAVLFLFGSNSTALCLRSRFSPYEWNSVPHCAMGRTPEVVHNQFSVSNSFWFITGTFLRQGSGLNPKVSLESR